MTHIVFVFVFVRHTACGMPGAIHVLFDGCSLHWVFHSLRYYTRVRCARGASLRGEIRVDDGILCLDRIRNVVPRAKGRGTSLDDNLLVMRANTKYQMPNILQHRSNIAIRGTHSPVSLITWLAAWSAAGCGFDLCHKYILYLYLHLVHRPELPLHARGTRGGLPHDDRRPGELGSVTRWHATLSSLTVTCVM